jgi:tetratricopeptide (TPR) repeat protein
LRGEFALASPLYYEAQGLLEHLLQRDPENRIERDLLAETLLDAGESLNMSGRPKEAEELFTRAHGIAERLATSSSKLSSSRRTLGRSLYRLSSVGLALGRNDHLSNAERAVQELRPLADASRPVVLVEVSRQQILPLSDQIELVFAQTLLAEGMRRSGQMDQAESQLRDSMNRMDSLATEFRDLPIDDIAYFHAFTAVQLAQVQVESKNEGANREALSGLNKAIDQLAELVNRSPKIRHFRSTLAQAYKTRARANESASHLDVAKADADAAHGILKRLVDEYPKIPDHQSDIGEVLDILGRVALSGRDREAASRNFAEAAKRHQSAVDLTPENPLYRERLAKNRLETKRQQQ